MSAVVDSVSFEASVMPAAAMFNNKFKFTDFLTFGTKIVNWK